MEEEKNDELDPIEIKNIAPWNKFWRKLKGKSQTGRNYLQNINLINELHPEYTETIRTQ